VHRLATVHNVTVDDRRRRWTQHCGTSARSAKTIKKTEVKKTTNS